MKVVKSVVEQVEEVETDDLGNQIENVETETDEAETVLGKRKDDRQPIQVGAPAGYVKGAAVVYHFHGNVADEVQASILDAIEAATVAAVEAAGLEIKVDTLTYHAVLRIGSTADLAKAPAKTTRKAHEPKVLTVETAKTFLNARDALTSQLIKAGTFDKANRPDAAREAMRLTLIDWNTNTEAAKVIMTEYAEALVG